MAQDRVVKVSLTAQVSNYVAGMEQARKATEDTSKAADNSKESFDRQNQAMSEVGKGLLAIGAVAAVGVALAVKKFADFDQAMSNVAAVTHETELNMNALREAALQAGADTVFTAIDAANAIEELGKAGLSTADILSGGLTGALDLAAAGGLGVAEAAGISATALKMFGLEGRDMAHVADLLAAGAGKAMGDVTDLSGALSQSGMVASSTGLSIEETTATLAAFASQGLLGSDAGTSFKSMLQRLTPQSAEAASKMKELGISAYDAQGNFIGMEKFAGNLQESLKGLTTEQRNSALATIFGTDAVRAATVIYSEGASGISDWISSVDDAGYASETAAKRLDNLNGDLEQLGGSFETALIRSGSAADAVLREIVQSVTELINAFNEAPVVVQQASLALGALGAAVLLTGGAFLLAVPKVAEFGIALQTLSTSSIPGVAASAVRMQGAIAASSTALSKTAAFLTGPWGLALAAATVGVIALDKVLNDFYATNEELTNSLKTSSSAAEMWAKATEGGVADWTTASVDGLENFKIHLEDSMEIQENWWAVFAHGTDGTFDFQKSLGRMGDALGELAGQDLPAAQEAFSQFAASQNLSADEQMAVLNNMPAYKDALIEQANQLGINVTSTNEAANQTKLLALANAEVEPTALDAADAYLAAADEAKGLDDKLQTLIDTLNEANGIGQDAISTNVAYQQAIADADEAIKNAQAGVEGYGLGLDLTTQAGRDNNDMLVDLAAKSQTAAEAQFALDGNTATYKATLEAGHQAVYDRAIALGVNADEAENLANKIYAIPSEQEFTMLTNIQDATRQLEEFRALWGGVTASYQLPTYFQNALRRADGGILPGAPSSRDNMFIHAASGEFVVNARQTANPANRRALEYMNAGGVITGYANGGVVRPQYASSFGTGGGNSYSSSGDTFNASFQIIPQPGQPIAEQVFTAARRLKVRNKGGRR